MISFVLSCSTSPDPEFERDNPYDSNANIPNARVIYPTNDALRSPTEQLSFLIRKNSAFKDFEDVIQIKSNIDGLIFEETEFEKDTIIVTETTLSDGLHTISLHVSDKKVQEFRLNVTIPNNLEYINVDFNPSKYNIQWSKYSRDSFKDYRLFTLTTNKFGKEIREYIDTFSDINDTAFIDSDYPLTTSFKYGIEVTDLNLANTNEIVSQLINVNTFKTDFSTIFSNKLSKLFYLDRGSSCLLAYNISTNEIDSTYSSIKTRSLYLNDVISNPELIVLKENSIENIELNTGSKTILQTERNFEYSRIVYEPELDVFMLINRGIPFLYDPNANTLEELPLPYDELLSNVVILPDEKILFSIHDNTGYATDYSDNFNFIESQIIPINIISTNSLTDNVGLNTSNVGQYLLGKKSSTGLFSIFLLPNYSEYYVLEANESFYTYFYFKEHYNPILFAGTNNGTVFIYDVTNRTVLYKQNYSGSIWAIFEFDNRIFVLVNPDDRTRTYFLRELDYNIE